jgi:hypothetical protein
MDKPLDDKTANLLTLGVGLDYFVEQKEFAEESRYICLLCNFEFKNKAISDEHSISFYHRLKFLVRSRFHMIFNIEN